MKNFIISFLFLSICQVSMAGIEFFCVIVDPNAPEEEQSMAQIPLYLGPTLEPGMVHEFHWSYFANFMPVPENIHVEYRMEGPETHDGRRPPMITSENWNLMDNWDSHPWTSCVVSPETNGVIPFYYPDPDADASKLQWNVPGDFNNRTIYVRLRNADNPNDYVVCAFPVSNTAGKTGAEQVSVFEESASVSVEVFPNPVVHQVNLYQGNEESGLQTVEIYNTEGKLVKEWSLEGVRQEQLDVSDLDAGIYILRVNGTESHRILKQ